VSVSFGDPEGASLQEECEYWCPVWWMLAFSWGRDEDEP
jgi:hypothetical protein